MARLLEAMIASSDDAILTTDLAGYVTSWNAAAERLYGFEADEVIGQHISFVAAAASNPDSATGDAAMRLRSAADDWRCYRTLIEPLAAHPAPGAGLAFALTRPPATDRSHELEEHLLRIAREVIATGVIGELSVTPPASPDPSLADLSGREMQIVTALLSGERVAMIARSLFLSESTVRNHLSSVYRKVGVRSQQELLTRLRANR